MLIRNDVLRVYRVVIDFGKSLATFIKVRNIEVLIIVEKIKPAKRRRVYAGAYYNIPTN